VGALRREIAGRAKHQDHRDRKVEVHSAQSVFNGISTMVGSQAVVFAELIHTFLGPLPPSLVKISQNGKLVSVQHE